MSRRLDGAGEGGGCGGGLGGGGGSGGGEGDAGGEGGCGGWGAGGCGGEGGMLQPSMPFLTIHVVKPVMSSASEDGGDSEADSAKW